MVSKLSHEEVNNRIFLLNLQAQKEFRSMFRPRAYERAFFANGIEK